MIAVVTRIHTSSATDEIWVGPVAVVFWSAGATEEDVSAPVPFISSLSRVDSCPGCCNPNPGLTMSSSPPTKALGGGARGGLALTDPVQDSATEEAKAAAAPSFKEFRGLEHPSARGDALLILSDGTEISGQAFGGRRSVSGEVVFATGMVGYPESLTDPSYRGQLLTLTYPLIGNYGVPPSSEGDPLVSGFESGKIQASALVISTLSRDFSHWQSTRSLDSWLKEEGIPGIEGVDVRALTQRLREHGTMTAKLIIEGDKDADDVFNGAFVDPGKRNLVAEVSV
ncbi:MAG TPA: hypothetical protein EYN00_02405, partial [Planctomycetes bacterium]|nr:hypothetical protein [Planctomycetota bacterium]